MQWEDVFRVVAAAIASLGGGGAIVLALSSWLGKVWASRILEADRAKYQLQIERLSRYSSEGQEVEEREPDRAKFFIREITIYDLQSAGVSQVKSAFSFE